VNRIWVEEKKANIVMAISCLKKKKLTWWSQSDCEKGKLTFGDCRMVGEKKANLVLMISWLEKRKLTCRPQSEGWRKES